MNVETLFYFSTIWSEKIFSIEKLFLQNHLQISNPLTI